MKPETSAGATRLQIDRVVKRYGPHTVLDDVSLTVEAGEFHVLLGPSGSGKSTLLRVIAGIERVDEGRVLLGDRVLADRRVCVPPERRNLGMVFQDYALWPHMTVADNVGYALRRQGIDRAEVTARVGALLERVGLGGYAQRHPGELSGGEQQRVALARALAGRPSLLLFDEPLSNLDADLKERLRVEIATLARETGATTIYITHDQSEAFALADRISVLRGGRLVQQGTPESIYSRPSSPFVARFTGLSGELSATVAGAAEDGAVHVRVLDRTLVAHAPTRPADGASVDLLMRPAALRIGRPDAAGAERTLTGFIKDTAYRGRGYDHVVELPDGSLLCGVFDQRAWPRGQTVTLTVETGGCFAYPSAGRALSDHPAHASHAR
ncbi:ABC transporter ATP-binding protein [Streptomyces sp. TP-A0356]|uniref:ABC transporter ATP-binding protein n=1 Tax=Streptomyces sp. TP-A0356 TaxID=1359208 RepID=UPI0006E31975|nr:ABC transporter ATP-binding protein [Streptomyces sp. TP-A0356]